MKASVQKNQNDKILKNIKEFVSSKASVKVGILSGEDGEILKIGHGHEFGIPSKGVAERSFLRSTMVTYEKEFKELLQDKSQAIQAEILQHGYWYTLNKFGSWWVDKVNETFENQGPDSSGAPWKELKDGPYKTWKNEHYPDNKLLMVTGALRRSISHEVVK